MQEVFEKIKERLLSTNVDGRCPELSCWEHSSKDCNKCDLIEIKIRDAIEIVNQVAEEYNQSLANNNQSLTNDGWIPCSERLPEEEYDTVLAVTDKNHYCVAVYTTEHGFRTMDIDCVGDFIAWQPLPEPYRGE